MMAFSIDLNRAINRENPSSNSQAGISLMVEDTRNILVVEPCRGKAALSAEFLTTLRHALARAIQAHYKLEAEELASEKLGEQGRYIFFWESAEGGAGVLYHFSK